MSIETRLYIKLKKYLVKNDWKVIGGQPPSGSDHLPVIEIKLNRTGGKGSGDAYKPDMVATKDKVLYIFEIKPKYSRLDCEKLLEVYSSDSRREALWKEIEQRGLVDELGAPISVEAFSLELAIANQDEPRRLDNIWQFLSSDDGFLMIHPRGGPII
jgi:hypothetical protein